MKENIYSVVTFIITFAILIVVCFMVMDLFSELGKVQPPKLYELFCSNGTLMYGQTIYYCDGHPFKCQGTYCVYITAMITDDYICGPKGQTCTEEIPIG